MEVVLASGDLVVLLDVRILPIILVLAIFSDEAFGDEVLGKEGVVAACSSPVAIPPFSKYAQQVLQESYLGRLELSSYDMYVCSSSPAPLHQLAASIFDLCRYKKNEAFFCKTYST